MANFKDRISIDAELVSSRAVGINSLNLDRKISFVHTFRGSDGAVYEWHTGKPLYSYPGSRNHVTGTICGKHSARVLITRCAVRSL